MNINSKEFPYVLFLSKHQLEAVELALRDSLEQHQEYDLYGPRTVNDMNMVLGEVHELIES